MELNIAFLSESKTKLKGFALSKDAFRIVFDLFSSYLHWLWLFDKNCRESISKYYF